MSLDVYLTMPGETHKYEARIFVREDGGTREMTRKEWDERFPDREPATISEMETDCVYEANITHNLNRMADAAGIYQHLWRPDEIGITKAKQLIQPLEEGLKLLQSDPERFEQYNASNGWGLYKHFVPWVSKYLGACREYPEAEVSVSR